MNSADPLHQTLAGQLLEEQVLEEQALEEVIKRLVAWGLPQDDVAYTLRGTVTWRELPPRAYLFNQNDPVDTVYLLITGSLFQERIIEDNRGQRRVVLRRDIQPGEWIGHYDLIFTLKHATRARATEACRLIAVQASALSRLIYRYPRIRQQLAPMDKIGRLRTVPIFGGLDLPTLGYVADACRVQRLPADTVIYTPQQEATDLYIIDQGQVRLTGDGFVTQGMGNGMAFGYLAAPPLGRHAAPRHYDHRAETLSPSTIFVIDRKQLFDLADLDAEIIGPQLRLQAENALDSVAIFNRYTQDERRALLGYMSHYFIPISHILMQQGELGDSLWILMPGSRATLFAVEESQGLQPTLVNGPNFFGELALRVHQTLNSTVQAEPAGQWLRLHVEDFEIFQRDHGSDLGGRLSLSPEAERSLGRAQERRRYNWLQRGENLILFQRRHLFALLRNVAISLVLSTLLIVFWVGMATAGWLAPWAFWVIALLGVGSALQFAWGLLDYLNDYLLVTNQRLVHQEKIILITEFRQAAFLEQIRTVEISTDFWGTFFNFGTVTVQTAASAAAITFDIVPNPREIKQIILTQQNLRQQNYQASSKMVIQNLLESRFGLRLRLPPHVHPPTAPPAIDQSWFKRFLRLFDIGAHLEIHVADRIIWRKHWFVLFVRALAPASILLVIIAILIGGYWLPAALQGFVLSLDIVLVLMGLGLVGWLAWLVADWRNDTYEIDMRQIADVEKKPLFFSEQRRTALLGEIENIEVRIPGPIHYLLNFGHVRLQTAAQQGEFTFDWVPNPRGVSEEIRRRIEIYRYEQENARTRQRAQELPDWFEMYSRLGAEVYPDITRQG
jgi:CRP-like cAMP-binding protein/membrane protein YdbS with pleckstrin-like domain